MRASALSVSRYRLGTRKALGTILGTNEERLGTLTKRQIAALVAAVVASGAIGAASVTYGPTAVKVRTVWQYEDSPKDVPAGSRLNVIMSTDGNAFLRCQDYGGRYSFDSVRGIACVDVDY
mgnify:FL=1